MLDQVILDAVLAEYPKEACGVFVLREGASVAVACRNASDDPENRFLIDPLELDELLGEDELLGVWHSHPDCGAKPSVGDVLSCNAFGVPFTIFATDGKTITDTFELPPHDERPYKGREYNWSAGDHCYGLVRDYCRRELGVLLPEAREYREEAWGTEEVFMSRFAEEGFVVVEGEFRIGDILLIKTSGSVTEHIAVYSKDDTILHHRIGRLSCENILSGYWHKHMTLHLRHKSQC